MKINQIKIKITMLNYPKNKLFFGNLKEVPTSKASLWVTQFLQKAWIWINTNENPISIYE